MQSTPLEPSGENSLFVLPEEGEPLHPPEKPFCYDPSCRCHEDLDHLADVSFFTFEGLMTEQEAAYFVAGRTI